LPGLWTGLAGVRVLTDAPRHQIPLRLEGATLDAIRHHPDYRESERGRVGGVAAWIRALIHRTLGLPLSDPHAEQSRERAGRPRRAWQAGRCALCGAEDPTMCGCEAPGMGDR